MRLTDFFPSRRYGVRCPTCARVARIPVSVVVQGVVLMLIELGAMMAIYARLGLHQPDSVLGLVVSGAVFLGMAGVGVWSLSLFGASKTHHLE